MQPTSPSSEVNDIPYKLRRHSFVRGLRKSGRHLERPMDPSKIGRHIARTHHRLLESNKRVLGFLALAHSLDLTTPEGPDSFIQILKRTTSIPARTNITLRRSRKKTRGFRSQTLFSAWHIRDSRGTNPPKHPPRYIYCSDLEPQPTPF